MADIPLQDGKVVLRDGKVGSGAACCCEGGACCLPDCGAAWTVDFLPDAGMGDAFKAFLEGRGYQFVQYAEDAEIERAEWTALCCGTDDGDVEDFTVTGGVNSTDLAVPLCISQEPEGYLCQDGITLEACEASGGTFYSGQTCADDPCGCPDVEGCNLVVVLDYPGAPQEYSNEPIGELGGNCLLSGAISDIPIESGGNITWNLTVGTDGNGNPVPQNITIVRAVDSPDNEQSCDDGITDCVPVLFTIDCNPLP